MDERHPSNLRKELQVKEKEIEKKRNQEAIAKEVKEILNKRQMKVS